MLSFKLKVQQAGQHHAAIINDIATNTWPEAFKDFMSQEQIQHGLNLFFNPSVIKKNWRSGQEYLIGKNRSFFLGFLTLEYDYNGTNAIKIHTTYVIPDSHKLGCGSAMLKAAEEIAKNRGTKELVLNVNKKNPAVNFFKNRGFEVVGEELVDWGDGFTSDEYVMRKTLA